MFELGPMIDKLVRTCGELAVARGKPFRSVITITPLAFTALIIAGGANAQTSTPASPKMPFRTSPPIVSAYCLSVSAGFLQSEARASEEAKKCTRGDTVVIPARSAGAVARMCDFSKAIVTAGENIVCVMVQSERGSK